MFLFRWAPALVGVLLVGCGNVDGGGAGSQPPNVVASFYPLAYVVEEVGGDDVVLENLTPPGAEPHDLELTPGQTRALAEADLVVYLGRGFQPSVEDAIGELDVALLDALDSQEDLLDAPGHDEEEVYEDEGHVDEAPIDPHVWLDPARLGALADVVAGRLARLDAANAGSFRANAADLRSRLTELDQNFREGLARCERSTIVTSHEAFGYLADAYGLEEIGVSGIDPEAEPSPGRLAEVAEFVRQNDVTTIFFEVLVSPQIAETIAREVGIETARLDPLEGPPAEGDYFTAMRSNLDALRHGLGCT